ncbi:hypothetical protein FGADI_11114 [Fusarium gaditjirri]|uniref:CN hydrolase domain-containing protein n=1 Tax=Fusarium gaditjirri TaxID=282569 RepID=A0A8H4SV91_9HYPO|nr:hypothetical protein FGADI_11114 [Fusarium gaditjirri]
MDPNSAPNSSNDKQDKVGIYVVQRCPRNLDLEHSVQTAIEEIATAAKAGASPTASSSHINRIRDAERENNIDVAMIGRDGSLRGVHRKLTPTHAERLVWANGDAQGPRAYDTSSAHQIASRQYAFESRCFVVAAASYLDKESVPPELLEAYVKGAGSTHLFIGGSSVIGRDGEYIAGPGSDTESWVVAIDIGHTIAYKHDLDVARHYGRPDIFKLLVNGEGDGR